MLGVPLDDLKVALLRIQELERLLRRIEELEESIGNTGIGNDYGDAYCNEGYRRAIRVVKAIAREAKEKR